MEEKLVNIMNKMAEYLSTSQLKKPREVLLKERSNQKAQRETMANADYLKVFLLLRNKRTLELDAQVLWCNDISRRREK